MNFTKNQKKAYHNDAFNKCIGFFLTTLNLVPYIFWSFANMANIFFVPAVSKSTVTS